MTTAYLSMAEKRTIALPTISCASRRIFSRIAASLNLEMALLFHWFCSLLCAKIFRRFGAIFIWQSNKNPASRWGLRCKSLLSLPRKQQMYHI